MQYSICYAEVHVYMCMYFRSLYMTSLFSDRYRTIARHAYFQIPLLLLLLLLVAWPHGHESLEKLYLALLQSGSYLHVQVFLGCYCVRVSNSLQDAAAFILQSRPKHRIRSAFDPRVEGSHVKLATIERNPKQATLPCSADYTM